jgi:SAM-dependent methyltransferase
MAEASDSTSVSAAGETYTLAYGNRIVQFFQERTLANCAGFFLPHLRPGMRVLDCGCGPGSLTIEIAERVAPGQVVGIDIEPEQCVKAQALATSRAITNVRFESADVYVLPYPDASFDAVFSHALVSHLADPVRAFAESRRVLKPTGVLAVSVNDYESFAWSPAGSAAERLGALYPRVMAHNGGNCLRPPQLRGALLDAGFARSEGYAGAEVAGTPEQLQRFAAGWADVARGSGLRQTVLSQGWADEAEMDALPDEILRWGERPDAFWAVLKCGALGWVNSGS